MAEAMSMALDQMISDGVKHDYARHGRFQPH
jgi:hypothetical protein